MRKLRILIASHFNLEIVTVYFKRFVFVLFAWAWNTLLLLMWKSDSCLRVSLTSRPTNWQSELSRHTHVYQRQFACISHTHTCANTCTIKHTERSASFIVRAKLDVWHFSTSLDVSRPVHEQADKTQVLVVRRTGWGNSRDLGERPH